MSFFSPETSNTGSTSIELIPAGTIAKVVIAVRDIKHSQSTGGRYLDLELIIDGGRFDRRRVFTIICDPWDDKTSEKAKEMAVGTITRIMESIGVFNPSNPETYNVFNNASINEVAMAMSAKPVHIVIGIQKGKDGRADKNEVKEWTSPNPKSNGYKSYDLAMKGAESVSSPTHADAIQAARIAAASPKPAQTIGAVKPPWIK
jgi:hypothetical protein